VSLSNDGDTVAIGASRAGDNDGQVRVHRHNGTDWQQVGDDIELVASDVSYEVYRELNQPRALLLLLKQTTQLQTGLFGVVIR
jgi:hypothetical protein